ncbi:hypothetical protein K0U27_10490 [archaeon]|nr:hypothetical protein [archaeon]
MAFIFVVAVATNQTSYAQCAYDPNRPHKPCDDVHVTLVIEPHEAKIENIDGQLFHIIGPFALEQESDDRIRLDGVTFTYPSYPNPPTPGGPVSVTITFENGAKERIFKIGAPSPFVEFVGVDPQAGVRRNVDGSFDFLLSVQQQLVSPLKQFKSGITIDEIQCRESLTLVTKNDGSPVCVKEQTVPKLIERGWLFVPDNDVIKQCAIEYDRIMRIPGCPSSGDGAICEPEPLIAKFIESSNEIANFKKMHCTDNVDEWSHLTEHEEDPNNGQIDWKLVSGIHHENPTFDVYGLNEKFQPIKVGKEIRSTIQYWDIVSCFDAETRIIDKLTRKIIFENIYTYECKNKQVGTFDKMMLRITDDTDWEIKLPGFYVLELESEKINLTEEFFVECTSGGCEFLTDEQLKGRQTHRND